MYILSTVVEKINVNAITGIAQVSTFYRKAISTKSKFLRLNLVRCTYVGLVKYVCM